MKVHCKGSLTKTTGLIVQSSFYSLEADIIPETEQPQLLMMPILLLKTDEQMQLINNGLLESFQ